MTPEFALEVLQRGIYVALQCAGPLLLLGIAVGLVMGLLQAATQVSEPSLTFVPKMAALAAALVGMGSWLVGQLSQYARSMFETIGNL